MACARSQRASQKPSRPASNATAIRLILRPAFFASPRQRCSSWSSPASSGFSFFAGCRSTPGTMPATSQLDWLISITAISVLFSSRAASDLLRSFGCGMGHPVGSVAATMMPSSRRSPHSISNLDEKRWAHRREKLSEVQVGCYSSFDVSKKISSGRRNCRKKPGRAVQPASPLKFVTWLR